MKNTNQQILNTPIEIALRVIIILSENKGYNFDIERLGYYDYISINLNDYSKEYESLHPNSPYRKGELSIKRPLIKAALLLLLKKDLIRVNYSLDGFGFMANKYSEHFIEQFQSSYACELKEKVRITSKLLEDKSNEDLKIFFDNFTKSFEKEYRNENILRGGLYEE